MNKQFLVSLIGATKREKSSGNIFAHIFGWIILLILFLIAIPIVCIVLLWNMIFVKSETQLPDPNIEKQWELMVKRGNTRILKAKCFDVWVENGDKYGYVYLRAEPDIPALNDEIYSEWFFSIEEGIFLQQLSSTEEPIASLIFIDTQTQNVECLQKDIPSRNWTMEKDANGFQLTCVTYDDILKYTVQFTSSLET